PEAVCSAGPEGERRRIQAAQGGQSNGRKDGFSCSWSPAPCRAGPGRLRGSLSPRPSANCKIVHRDLRARNQQNGLRPATAHGPTPLPEGGEADRNRSIEMGRKVFVVGVGMTKFEKPGAKAWDYPDMAREAGTKALEDAGLSFDKIEQVA